MCLNNKSLPLVKSQRANLTSIHASRIRRREVIKCRSLWTAFRQPAHDLHSVSRVVRICCGLWTVSIKNAYQSGIRTSRRREKKNEWENSPLFPTLAHAFDVHSKSCYMTSLSVLLKGDYSALFWHKQWQRGKYCALYIYAAIVILWMFR